MTKKSFNWDRKTWDCDYEEQFENCKKALAESVAIHMPDYTLAWIMRVDASDLAVGAVLMQVRTLENGDVQHEPLGFASHKFTPCARKWDTFKKEAYAIFFGVNKYSYYLRGKSFVLETDHRNLVWIQNSIVPIVMRWRSFLQSFDITIKHIPGSRNLVADWLSRAQLDMLSHRGYLQEEVSGMDYGLLSTMFALVDPSVADEVIPNTNARVEDRASYLLKQIHGGRNLHYGARRTWRLLESVVSWSSDSIS
jgi:phospholipid-translocating ATPase